MVNKDVSTILTSSLAAASTAKMNTFVSAVHRETLGKLSLTEFARTGSCLCLLPQGHKQLHVHVGEWWFVEVYTKPSDHLW